MKSLLFFALGHDNTVSKERLKVSNYLLIILFYTCLCTNIYKMFSQHYVSHFNSETYVLTSQVRNPLYTIVHFIVLTSQVRNIMYTPHWNTLPYIGKFDGQTAFGIYGLAATYRHNNTNQALQPCCNTHTIHCGYG